MTDDSFSQTDASAVLASQGETLEERVFDTALSLFAERGYHATSVDEILKAAGVSKGGFYHHFKSKEDVLFAIKSKFADYVCSSLHEIAAEEKTASEKLAAVIRMMLGIIGEHRDHVVIFVQENGTLGPKRISAIRATHAACDRQVRKMIEQGKASGEFRQEVSAPIVTEALFGMCNWTYRWFDPEGELDVDQIATIYHQLILAGVKADNSVETSNS